MNIEQKELINIIREELAEVLGMDAQDDRQNLTMKVRNLLDEYTGDDLEAAYDTLTSVQAMLRYEMAQAAEEDEEYGSGRDKVYDDERAADERGDPAHPLKKGALHRGERQKTIRIREKIKVHYREC